jgi:uncharacterized repeat protein (TIGR01451 family)
LHSLVRRLILASSLLSIATAAAAQPLQKSAINVDPGSTKQTGQTFTYRLTYNCSSTSGPCLNAQVTDLLPAEVQFVDTVPAAPAGDVSAVNVTPNFGGSGRTRVQFVLNTPLPAGNSGDLLIDVRFPNGSTANGTVATNTADGINLGPSPGTTTTPPVSVTAVAALQVALSKTLTTSPANLDLPESYRLRITNTSNGSGSLNLTSLGPVTDTLPAGVVFNGSAPAADCQPGCLATTPATLTWTAPCSVPVTPGSNCDITVNVTFPSATFTSGTNATNSFTATGTPLGQPPQSLGVGQVTHPVTTFVPNASLSLSKSMAGATPNPPTLNQTFSYDFNLSNNGNVPLDGLTLIDTLPIQLQLSSVTTGSYNNLFDFAAGVGVRVSYEKNTAPAVFTLWGSSPNATTTTTLTSPPPGLGAGEYVTRIKWEYGQAAVGMSTNTRPLITGKIVNPGNTGAPVGFGDTIQNCVAGSAVYTAGPTNVNNASCRSFVLSGPFVQLNPAKDNLTGGSVNPGQNVSWRLRVRSAAQSSDPVPLQDVVAADLLPLDLLFTSWSFDDQSTGLPAPQNFQQIPNYQGSGRTLLRWSWNAGSGNLAVNQQVWINVNTTVRNGAVNGNISNTFDLTSNAPGLSQRCSGGSITDAFDLDGDSNTADTLCTAGGTATVPPIAQLVSSKTIQGTCDGGAVASSSGTLTGGSIRYHLHVGNPGTVPMQNFVLIDILPFVGDTGVRDTSPRGSQWTPLLAAPIAPPPGTTIYYTTAGNPCRGEVGGPTSGCTPPNWTTVAPDPITSVRAFKIEFGSRVVNPGDGIDFDYVMVTPGNVPPGTFAYNSFAYQADRSDGIGSLAAEPQKVGLSLGACNAAALGDYVWVDANHDGIQNDGPTGLNNVFLQLYTPGTDGIPNTSDDVPLSSTVTSNSPTSQPGWYFFPGLAPGTYYVKIVPPATFTLTTPDATIDTLDSDGSPATFSSGPRTLIANQTDPDVDFGLYTTNKAALGDYAWFDRNGDGLQDEAPTDGADGVTVRLFVDQGNGTPDAGDVLVGTTITADDPYGRPGYYVFDQLIPGLPYYVQFVLPSVATGFTSQHTGADSTTDSDASVLGNSQIVTLAPDEVNRTIDAGLIAPTGTLSLGDQVWLDNDNDGLYEPQNGELGIDNVRLDLYVDVNADGKPTADEYLATTSTQTVAGFAGRYVFDGLASGNYIVVVHPSSFTGGGALYGLVTSTGNDPAPDPDDDVNGDDNGTYSGALIASHPVTLTTGGEPTSEDGNNNTNLTVDFGFTPAAAAPVLSYDYGDAPDVGVGTSHDNYNTTALDNGPFHLLGVPNAPYLGNCVDADAGALQNAGATADDTGPHALVVGNCSGTNDEDGVTFSAPMVPGSSATFNVTANGPSDCRLDAWVDWNQDGVFGNSAGEQIATNLNVVHGAGAAALNPTVPANAIPGITYARFRCSSAGNLPPTGTAADGEVEDYAVSVLGYDYGDAPASYGTQGAGAARHAVIPGNPLRLGSCVDTEDDGQPLVTALGDDSAAGTSRAGTCADDEDGVVFSTPIVACGTSNISVTTNAAAKLDAWIDFNRNGIFDAGDQIANNLAVVAGANALSVNVPCTVSPGLTYARFRLSTAGGLTATGTAADGEVEDYAVTTFGLDFGDAPDTYQTLLASNGARHTIVPGYSLGATEDNEADGQPSVGASGDGVDEDGVSFPAGLLNSCSTVSLAVTLTNTAGLNGAKLDAWIDFDGDGHFDSPRDRIATGVNLVSGANTVMFTVPCDAKSVTSYARFRLSSTGTGTPNGAASDGEVEDYVVGLAALDFGDAPDPTFPTLLSSNGARHRVLPVNNPTLGSVVDTEVDGQPSAGATGDDSGGVDDEDGVTFPSLLIAGAPGHITLRTGATGGIVSCWIDLNRNGAWAPSEEVVTDASMPASTMQTFTFPVPVNSVAGAAMSRCRISTLAGLGLTGEAPNGELEDHVATVTIEHPSIATAICVVGFAPDPTRQKWHDVSLDISLQNTGDVMLTDVNATMALATVFTPPPFGYEIISVTSPDFAINNGYNGNSDVNLLAPAQTLASGATGIIHLSLRITANGEAHTFTVTSRGTGTSPASTIVTDDSQDGCVADPDHDGNAGNNSVPTTLFIPPFAGIPLLEPRMLLLLAALLAIIAIRKIAS